MNMNRRHGYTTSAKAPLKNDFVPHMWRSKWWSIPRQFRSRGRACLVWVGPTRFSPSSPLELNFLRLKQVPHRKATSHSEQPLMHESYCTILSLQAERARLQLKNAVLNIKSQNFTAVGYVLGCNEYVSCHVWSVTVISALDWYLGLLVGFSPAPPFSPTFLCTRIWRRLTWPSWWDSSQSRQFFEQSGH